MDIGKDNEEKICAKSQRTAKCRESLHAYYSRSTLDLSYKVFSLLRVLFMCKDKTISFFIMSSALSLSFGL